MHHCASNEAGMCYESKPCKLTLYNIYYKVSQVSALGSDRWSVSLEVLIAAETQIWSMRLLCDVQMESSVFQVTCLLQQILFYDSAQSLSSWGSSGALGYSSEGWEFKQTPFCSRGRCITTASAVGPRHPNKPRYVKNRIQRF